MPARTTQQSGKVRQNPSSPRHAGFFVYTDGRSDTPASYVVMPRAVLNSPEWANLSPYAIKLFFEVYRQYNGFNNGNLSIPWSLLLTRGWNSPATVTKYKRELLDAGFLIQTRQGGKNRCSLFAVTVKAIDACLDSNGNSRYDAGIKPTPTAPGGWRKKTPVQAVN